MMQSSFFIVLPSHYPVLDGVDEHLLASVHFALTSVISNIEINFWGCHETS